MVFYLQLLRLGNGMCCNPHPAGKMGKQRFCVIYGFGVFIAYDLFQPIEHNYVALYIWGCIAATIFEYLTAQVMLRLFVEVWWDYTHKKINYKGILCLQSTLGWGFLALFIFGIFNRLVENLVFALDEKDSIINAVHGKFVGTKVTV